MDLLDRVRLPREFPEGLTDAFDLVSHLQGKAKKKKTKKLILPLVKLRYI